MPPALDIYVLATKRDRETIDRFLDLYVDRAESEDRGTEELMIVRLNHHADYASVGDSAWQWETSLTLSHIIDRGLALPHRAFTNYLASKPETDPVERAMLTSTMDDKLILGLLIDDEGMRPENEQQARKLLAELAEQFDATLGLILVETPPPLSESEFYKQEGQPLMPFFWARDRTNSGGASIAKIRLVRRRLLTPKTERIGNKRYLPTNLHPRVGRTNCLDLQSLYAAYPIIGVILWRRKSPSRNIAFWNAGRLQSVHSREPPLWVETRNGKPT